MNPVESPLQRGDKGAKVAALPEALIVLFKSGAIFVDGHAVPERYVAELNKDLSKSTSGERTAKVLAGAQQALGMRGAARSMRTRRPTSAFAGSRGRRIGIGRVTTLDDGDAAEQSSESSPLAPIQGTAVGSSRARLLGAR